MKPALAVDWDATLVENVWPEEGKWLPGAVKALKQLTEKYQVYIHTCRIAPVMHNNWDIPLSKAAVAKEMEYIHRMLREAGLDDVKLWNEPYKIPAVAYIDDKGLRFEGNWPRTLRQLNRLRG